MSKLCNTYDPNWKDIGSVLLYQSNDFQFYGNVLITNLEEGLIKSMSSSELYHTFKDNDITLKDADFIKQILKQSYDMSLVIISNHISNNKLNIDMIKRKLEGFSKKYKIPVLAFFALKPNRMSKPHTGLWKLLNMYYQSKGNSKIHKAIMVSDYGGRIVEDTKKNGTIKTHFDKSDIDRAFANNINIPFYTINEYLTPGIHEKFTWNNTTISPELRQQYILALSTAKNPNIFAKLLEQGIADRYMILIYGAPSCGKTTLAKELLAKWTKSEWGQTHAIKHIGDDKGFKSRLKEIEKTLINRISVIVDGECHTSSQQHDLNELIKKYKVNAIYVEVNPGIGMSYLFNHVGVEMAKDENKCLYSVRDYHIYKSVLCKPANYALYCPVIKQIPQVMSYRY